MEGLGQTGTIFKGPLKVFNDFLREKNPFIKKIKKD
tara:strand:+ start:1311 stop:1418 length:108 start_codon:yes stop_codon:yes gene_type:complete